MKPSTCLSEQDLTLLHYGENPEDLSLPVAQKHLADCANCRDRQARLARDLNRMPALDPDLAQHNAARLTARVIDRLPPRRRSLFPAMAGAFSAAAIVFAISIWTPGTPVIHNPSVLPQVKTEQTTTDIDINDSVLPQVTTEQPPSPDFDLLENLELLRELDTLSDLAGV